MLRITIQFSRHHQTSEVRRLPSFDTSINDKVHVVRHMLHYGRVEQNEGILVERVGYVKTYEDYVGYV